MMPAHLTLTDEKPAARTNRDGLDFVLQTATQSHEDQVDEHIFEIPEFFKPSL